jgi:hypothetical protein
MLLSKQLSFSSKKFRLIIALYIVFLCVLFKDYESEDDLMEGWNMLLY